MFCFCFLLIYLFIYSFVEIPVLKHNYLEIHQTHFRQMFTFGRTMAVDERCEISFSIPHILLVLVRGVVGRERLVAQPSGLTLGFALHLVSFIKKSTHSTV